MVEINSLVPDFSLMGSDDKNKIENGELSFEDAAKQY